VSRDFSPRVSVSAAAGLSTVTVALDGRRVLTTKKSKFRLSVKVRRLTAGGHRLTIVAVDLRNRSTTSQRSFAKCAARPKPRPRFTG
jgi:hypothetical protein